MPVDLNHRRVRRQEVRIQNIFARWFKKQEKYLMSHLEELYNKPNKILSAYNYINRVNSKIDFNRKQIDYDMTPEPLWWFWVSMWIYDVVQLSKKQIKKIVNKWYKKRWKLAQEKLMQQWVLFNSLIWDVYWWMFEEIHLSNYKWSISRTTKMNILTILKEGIDNNLTYWQVRDEIVELNSVLFSKDRAELIAVSEMWRAYEYWNRYPMKQAQDMWMEVKKKRLTVRDSRVRPTHMENENAWWVNMEYVYPWTNNQFPPSWVRCRCTTGYKII